MSILNSFSLIVTLQPVTMGSEDGNDLKLNIDVLQAYSIVMLQMHRVPKMFCRLQSTCDHF